MKDSAYSTLLVKTAEHIASIDSTNLEAWKMVRSSPAETLSIAQELLERSEELEYLKGIAWAKGNIAAAHTWLGDYEEAIQNCYDSIDLLHDCGELKHEVQIEYYLFIVFYFLGDSEKQMEHAKRSYARAEEIGDKLGMANALNGIGTVHYTYGRNDEAIEILEQGLTLATKLKDASLLGRIYNGLGVSYMNKDENQDALTYMEQALVFVTKADEKQSISYVRDGIGEIQQRLGNYADALVHFNAGYALREEMGFRDGMGIIKLHIAENYSLAGDNLSSVQNYKDALALGIELDSKELIYKSHLGLSELYEDMGNHTLFVKHFKAYHESQQLFLKERDRKKIKASELKGKLDQIQKEKEELERKHLELETYFEDMQTLSSIGNEITSTLDIEGIFQIIYERINTLMEATGIFIGICNYDEHKLQVKLAIDNGKRDGYFEHSLDGRKLANHVVKTGETVHINNYEKEIKSYFKKGEEILHSAPNSVVIIPLMVKEKLIGVLYAQSDTISAFSKHHVNILTSFANYLAIALDNASLYEQMDAKVKERTEELEVTYKNSELLNRIGQELISTLDFEDVFKHLYKNVNKLMDATVFGVRLLDKENNLILYPYEYERGKRLKPMQSTLDDDNNYSVWCVKNKKEILINDNETEYKKYVEKVVVIDGDFPYSLIFYPLIADEKVIGVISVQSFDRNAYTNYHLTIVKTLAQYTSLALQNARRYEIMEETVKERTSEITKTYENSQILSEIGKNITSQLSVEAITNIAYDNINRLMDGAGFGIGVFVEERNTIEMPGYIEDGKTLEGGNYDVDDPNRLAAICFKKEQEIVINNFEQEHHKYIKQHQTPKVGKSVNSLIYLPIRAKDKAIGVVTVQSFENNAYSEYEVSMLRAIGVYIGIGLDNAALYQNMEEIVKERTSEVVEQKEEIEKAYQNTKLISQINKVISESITIESIIDSVYENVNTLMDATGFGIGVYDEDKEVITMKGYIEKGEKLPDFSYHLDDERIAPWCFNNQKEIFISDYTKEYKNYIKGVKAPVSGKDSSSIIYIPLFSKEKIVGLFTVQSFDKNAYTEYHMDILRGLAATIAGAIENATLYESLEEKVKERTAEVVKQKEQIEKASENTRRLSEIGKDIASELSTSGIVSKVYESVNQIMEASIFGIGVYREEDNGLFFSGAMEKGTSLDDFVYNIEDERIATICFNNTQEIVINDWGAEFHKYVKEDYTATEGGMPESMIYLPLVSKGNKIGVMTIQSFSKNVYSDYHLNILRTLSLYIANALENASLYQGMEDRVKERTAEIEKAYEDTKLLSQISKVIVESLEVEAIIDSVYESINTLLDATCFGIGLHDEKRNGISMPGFIENGNHIEGLFFDLSEKERLATMCFEEEKELFISDFEIEYKKYFTKMMAPVKGGHSRSIIYLPLRTSDRVIGVMTVQSYEPDAYTENHLNILRSIATTVATALDNAMLYESMEDKVKERTLELSQQKEIIEEKNKHITDSIRYAKRIQDATLPSIGLVRSYLADSFVLFKPKDIVSGDFYWVEQVDDRILFAVVDCTGHGVPGAFLSLIGHNSLNQIVNELGIYRPADILHELDRIVYNTLQNNLEHTNIKDGMDMSVVSLNTKTLEIEFAGANNPLYYVRDNTLQEIKGNKLAIGMGELENKFTNHEMQMIKGDKIYLFSDGYADQFGGPKGKKFKYSQFKELIVKIHQREMEEQHKLLNHYIDAWQGDLEQLDDVCVIGVSV